jgi:hypothetical protein
MLRYWTFDDRTQLVLYADVGGLLHTDLGSAVVPAALALAGAGLSGDQAQCIRGATSSVKDLVLGADDDAGLLVVRFDEGAFQPGPCLTAAKATPKTLEGAREAYVLNGSIVAHVPGMLLLGPEEYVVRALKPRSTPASWPSSVSLGPDEYAAWHLHAGAGIEGKGSLLASSTRFRVAMEGDLPEVLAENVEREWQARKSESAKAPLPAEQAALLQKLVESIDVKRSGGHLTAAFDLQEPPVDQARDLGAAASIAIVAVRRYMSDAKSAEARVVVGQIAKDTAAWYESEDPAHPKARKRLVSFPPVPKAVPRGVKYQSTLEDWKPWAPLKFSMESPQYYQYEVRAAKDGGSEDIFARGDLDGDGKASEFKLHVAIDRKKGVLVIGPSLEERDSEE